MPLYTIKAVVWSDHGEGHVEGAITDALWELFDDVPACDVEPFREP